VIKPRAALPLFHSLNPAFSQSFTFKRLEIHPLNLKYETYMFSTGDLDE